MCRLAICDEKEKGERRKEKGRSGKQILTVLLSYALTVFFLISCNFTKNLPQGEYALTRNTVKVVGEKTTQFDDLIDLVRPIPNKKFMEIFPIKVSLWAYHQPKYDSIKDITKDSKFNRWLRRIGESPVLLDTTDLQRSINQIELAMFKLGYFDAQASAEIQYLKKQKARVNYFVTKNQPYFIRNVNYQIDIPEYKRLIITDTVNSLLKTGKIYNEEELVAERKRIINRIKDKGYYYASDNLVTFLVDTNQAFAHHNAQNNPTLSITVKVSFEDIEDKSLITKSINRYNFNNVLIYTNYDLSLDKNIHLDTIPYLDFRNKSDSTLYEFVTLKKLKKNSHRLKLVKDFKSRTIVGAIGMKRGDIFSQTAMERTYKKMRDLRNFSIINISYYEDEALWDSIHKTGTLNTIIRLTRAKRHGTGGALNIQTDRTSLEYNYTNKNIFRGAEYFKIGAYGSIYYYSWVNSKITGIPSEFPFWGEVGGSASLTFPRLLMLPKHQKINFWSYSTEIKFLGNYTQRFSRLNLQASYTYRWSPTRVLSHAISPIELATLDSRSNRESLHFAHYPDSYKRKFDKFFLSSSKYQLIYKMPQKNGRHTLNLSFSFETVGVLVNLMNRLVNKDEMWTIMKDFKYGTFEKFDIDLTHVRIINKNNSFATHFAFGMAIPFVKGAVIPFERSFFVGGANSMRGWGFRQLGPGAFHSKNEIERVGDMKLELDLEYRGPIYKAFKFAVFADMGNVWLLSKYENMPDAEFNFSNFYKQIALCVGAGLRLDFNYFLVRLDYGVPLYDPSKPVGNYWINKSWKTDNLWNGLQGIQLGVNYAF